MSQVMRSGNQDFQDKILYKDFRLAPLPIQIDDSFDLYFQNKEKRLFKFNIEAIAEDLFTAGRVLGEVHVNSPQDSWHGDSIILTDDELITKTGENRKSIPYGVELMLHYKFTPIIDRFGYIRNLACNKVEDIKILTWIRMNITHKVLNAKIRKYNKNRFNMACFTPIDSQNVELVEINCEDEKVWVDLEKLRPKPKKVLENNVKALDFDV